MKKDAKNRPLALQDLRQADFFLNEALDLLNLKKKEMASIALYNSVFHAARSLLFKDGVKERSHFCVQKYLEEKYEKTSLLSKDDIALFDIIRGIRQEVQYGVSKIKFEENLPELYDKAEIFIQKIGKIIAK